MADNINVTPGSGLTMATTDTGGVHTPHSRVVSVDPPSTVVHGQKTVAAAGTEEALGATTALAAGVTVKALAGNSGTVYVGANPVTSSTGFELAAGESVFLPIDDLASVYIDVATNGDGVSYLGG